MALARHQGLYQTARALRLDYGGLQQHVEAADARDGARRPLAFVEFAGSTLTDLGTCVIESTGPRGTVRLRVPGLALADLATLTRTLAGAGRMIQITPQMRILVAVDAQDFRKGIDGLARICRGVLEADPFCGALFVFRNRRGTRSRCWSTTRRDFGSRQEQGVSKGVESAARKEGLP